MLFTKKYENYGLNYNFFLVKFFVTTNIIFRQYIFILKIILKRKLKRNSLNKSKKILQFIFFAYLIRSKAIL